MNASHHRWRVLIGLVGVYSAFGMAVTALAPMLTLVQEDIGASRGSMGLALGAWAFMFIFTAPLAGRFIDRFGIGWAVALGGCSVSGSLLARADATSVSSMWLAVALFGVFGPLISASAPTFVTRWFPDETERRRAVGIYVVAPAVGGVVIVATTNSFLLPLFDDSWRRVLIAESALAAALTVVWAVTYATSTKPSIPRPKTTPEGGHLRELLGSSGVRLALGLAFTVFFVNHSLGPWTVTVVEDLGDFSPSVASNWTALAGLVGIGISAVVPNFANPRRVVGLLIAAFIVLACGLCITALGSPPLIVIGTIVSAARSALIPLTILILMEADRVTPSNAGLANGIWFAVGEVGGVTGPLVMGLIADSSAGFTGGLLVVAGLAFATAIGTRLATVSR